jgi:geranyl-CoA carboxylase alpha subunit
VQRRHQKVVEEAPCPVMTPDLRARMGAAAVEAARSIAYVGAGTVEFLLDAEGAFYFLEMNTRLQVEHPVTEAVTGLDLVALQLQVAQGRPLDISQNRVELSGHAIELRLYAEDPARDFLPDSGRIVDWRPADGEGIRVDAGIAAGQDVPPHYDPMLAKLVAWGEDRPQALRRLREALRRSRLFGVTSNREFLAAIVDHPDFAAGRFSTAFIDEAFPGGFASAAATDADFAAAGLLLYRAQRERMRRRALRVPAELLDWHSGHGVRVPLALDDGQRRLELSLSPLGVDRYTASVGDRTLTLTILELGDGSAHLDIDGCRQELGFCVGAADTVHLAVAARTLTLRNVLAAAPEQAQGGSGGRVAAPMHGVLVELLVQPGDPVEPGGRLAVLEAMKMQHELLAPVGGTVREVSARAGQQVAADDVLIVIEEQEA